MTDRDTLIPRLREAIYALCVEAAICATNYSEANQKRLDARQAEVDAIIKEVADELVE